LPVPMKAGSDLRVDRPSGAFDSTA
jgi:hypothetical protein